MEKKMAVVFDCAGTLLRMYRVAKETATGNILEGIESIMLVADRPGRALVVMHAEPALIERTDPRTELRKFISDNGLKIDISCSSGPVSIEEAISIINEQKIVVGDVIEVLTWAQRSCPEI
ncbi:MAG: hypothetical protein KK926_05735, partial [Methanomethylovorans sp.]|nr:hypothetical protein [Methanomethylovorans sp.]